ncbi:E3 ubiquitin/ISG15 ligase TRIM25-like [Hyperolius riggenbachi]|uniref:E3 ubiquitin/ISG15 ligase TRIM25-like n=1 Tax=Hyperolius riggenbachi TaxID=752182 RepID=UPI0035A2DE92
MAFANVSEELNCCICLNVYQDPVVLRCGHNFCSRCIGGVLDAQEGSEFYSCPQCRTEFVERPALHRNIALKNIAESLQPNIPEQEISGILCSYCINSSAPAVKTCVHCEASLCEGHVKVHNKAAEHVLIEPTTCVKNRKCSVHKKILEYYCNEDSVYICMFCRLDGKHKQHLVTPINDIFKNKRKKLKDNLEELSSQRVQVKNRIQALLDHQIKVKGDASTVKKTVTDLFRTIQKKLDALEKKINDAIHKREDAITTHITKSIQNLEAGVDNFSKKMKEIERLCNMTDPLGFLQEIEAEKDDNMKTIDHKALVKTKEDFGVLHLHEGFIVTDAVKDLFHIMNQAKTDANVHTNTDIVLDMRTAGQSMMVSKDLKTVTMEDGTAMFYPFHPMRFVNNQILSKTQFSSGKHYWQVEVGRKGNWRIGVAYSTIGRSGNLCSIGSNNKSWVLRKSNNKCGVMHNDEEKNYSFTFSSENFGIYLDYEAGQLSFYELGDAVKHLYTFTATFAEPLHAAFLLYGTYAKIKKID